MAYADQQMSGNRITALIIVALIHILLVYALVTGLAYSGMIAVVKRVTTVDITDEPEKEPPPPPKTKVLPPPIVVPPPRINVNVAPRQIDAIPSFSPQPVQTVQPTFTPTPTPTPTPTEAPGPRVQPRAAAPRGNPGSWATTNDYPSRALREERAGTTGFRLTVGADGRATGCTVTSSSGHGDLDEATCSNVMRRARFTPATDGEGQPTTGSYSGRIRWVIPDE
jgi:periplasmic protein TonB